MAIKLEELFAEVRMRTTNFERGVHRVMQRTKSMRTAWATAGADFAKVSKRIGIAMVGVGTASTKMAMTFQDNMTKIRNMMVDMADRDFERVEKGIQRLAVKYGRSTSAMADGVFEMTSAGNDVHRSLKDVEGVMPLVVAGQARMGDATKLVGTIVNAYNMKWSDSLRISDLVFKTNEKGVTTVSELAGNMGSLVNVAKNLNIPLEELFGSMASTTKGARNTSDATTQLRSLMMSLAGGTDELNAVVRKHGFVNSEAMVKQLGLVKSSQLLFDATGGSIDQLKKMMGRVEAVNGLLNLTGSNSKRTADAIAAMGNAGGTASKALKKAMGTDVEKFRRSMQEFNKEFLKLGRELLPTLTKFLKENKGQIIEFIRTFAGLTKTVAELVAKYPKVAAFLALFSIGRMTGIAQGITSVGKALYLTGKKLKTWIGSSSEKIASSTAATTKRLTHDVDTYLNTLKSSSKRAYKDVELNHHRMADRITSRSVAVAKTVTSHSKRATDGLTIMMQRQGDMYVSAGRNIESIFKRMRNSASKTWRHISNGAKIAFAKISLYASGMIKKVAAGFAALKAGMFAIAGTLATLTGILAIVASIALVLGTIARWNKEWEDSQKRINDFYEKRLETMKKIAALNAREAEAEPREKVDERVRALNEKIKRAEKGLASSRENVSSKEKDASGFWNRLNESTVGRVTKSNKTKEVLSAKLYLKNKTAIVEQLKKEREELEGIRNSKSTPEQRQVIGERKLNALGKQLHDQKKIVEKARDDLHGAVEDASSQGNQYYEQSVGLLIDSKETRAKSIADSNFTRQEGKLKELKEEFRKAKSELRVLALNVEEGKKGEKGETQQAKVQKQQDRSEVDKALRSQWESSTESKTPGFSDIRNFIGKGGVTGIDVSNFTRRQPGADKDIAYTAGRNFNASGKSTAELDRLAWNIARSINRVKDSAKNVKESAERIEQSKPAIVEMKTHLTGLKESIPNDEFGAFRHRFRVLINGIRTGKLSLDEFSRGMQQLRADTNAATAAAQAEAEQKRREALLRGDFKGAGLDFKKALNDRIAQYRMGQFNKRVEKRFESIFGGVKKAVEPITQAFGDLGGRMNNFGSSLPRATETVQQFDPKVMRQFFETLNSPRGQFMQIFNLISQLKANWRNFDGKQRLKALKVIRQLQQQAIQLRNGPPPAIKSATSGLAGFVDPGLQSADAGNVTVNVPLNFPNLTRMTNGDMRRIMDGVQSELSRRGHSLVR